MKFSIIIPVYNVEKYLRECLQSVVNQSFNDFEVICVNDGSADGSLQILRQYESQFANFVVIDSENGGTASARNKGLRHAKGEYVWFVDSDDWIERNSLEILAQHIDNQTDILHFNGKLFYENTAKIDFDEQKAENFASGWDYYNKYALQQRKFHFVCVVLRLYRREFLLQNQLFFDKNTSFEDNLWIPQVFYFAKKVVVVTDMLYFYRIRQGSKMQETNAQRFFDKVLTANKLAEFFIPKTDIDKRIVYREIAGEYFSGFLPSQKIVPYKKLKEAIKWDFYKAVSIYPRHKRIYKLLKINTFLFHIYLFFEQIMRK